MKETTISQIVYGILILLLIIAVIVLAVAWNTTNQEVKYLLALSAENDLAFSKILPVKGIKNKKLEAEILPIAAQSQEQLFTQKFADLVSENIQKIQNLETVASAPATTIERLCPIVPIDKDFDFLKRIEYEEQKDIPEWTSDVNYLSETTWTTDIRQLAERCARMYDLLSYINYDNIKNGQIDTLAPQSKSKLDPSSVARRVVNKFIQSMFAAYAEKLPSINVDVVKDEETLRVISSIVLPFLTKYVIVCRNGHNKLYSAITLIDSSIDNKPDAIRPKINQIYTGFAYMISCYFQNSIYPFVTNDSYRKCKNIATDMNNVDTDHVKNEAKLLDGTFHWDKFVTYQPLTHLEKFGGKQFYQFINETAIFDDLMKKVYSQYMHPTIPTATLGLFSNNLRDLAHTTNYEKHYKYGALISSQGKLLRISNEKYAFFYRMIMPDIPYMKCESIEDVKCLQYFTQYLGLRSRRARINPKRLIPQMGFICTTAHDTELADAKMGLNALSGGNEGSYGVMYKYEGKLFAVNCVNNLYHRNLIYTTIIKYDETLPHELTVIVRAKSTDSEIDFILYAEKASKTFAITSMGIEVTFSYDLSSGKITSEKTSKLNEDEDWEWNPDYYSDLSMAPHTIVPYYNTVTNTNDFIVENQHQVPVIYCNSQFEHVYSLNISVPYRKKQYLFTFDRQMGQYMNSHI